MATTTPQNYTDADLVKALRTAALDDAVQLDVEEGSTFIADFEITDLRRILDALPDLQDDWQECEFSDLRKGDRVRLEFADITHEAVVKTVRKNEIVIGGNHNFTLYRYKNPKIYRIPAPVVRPDPEEHPVILVTKYEVAGNPMDCEPTPFFLNGLGTYANDTHALLPREVLEFTPAKVIADE